MGALNWKGAEQLCFNYLLTAAQTVVGVEGFCPEVPDAIAESPTAQHWQFTMNGGEVQMTVNSDATGRTQRCTHGMDAMIEGFFVSRPTAQDVASMMVNALPAGNTDITGIMSLSIVSMPVITPAIKTTTTTTAGRPYRGWSLTIPLRVQMGTVTYDG